MSIIDGYNYQGVELIKTPWHEITFRSAKFSPRKTVLENNIGNQEKIQSSRLLWSKCLKNSSMKFIHKRLDPGEDTFNNMNRNRKNNCFIVLSRMLVNKLT